MQSRRYHHSATATSLRQRRFHPYVFAFTLLLTGISGCSFSKVEKPPETHFVPCVTVIPETQCPPVEQAFDPDGKETWRLIEAYGDAHYGHQVCATDLEVVIATLKRCVEE